MFPEPMRSCSCWLQHNTSVMPTMNHAIPARLFVTTLHRQHWHSAIRGSVPSWRVRRPRSITHKNVMSACMSAARSASARGSTQGAEACSRAGVGGGVAGTRLTNRERPRQAKTPKTSRQGSRGSSRKQKKKTAPCHENVPFVADAART